MLEILLHFLKIPLHLNLCHVKIRHVFKKQIQIYYVINGYLCMLRTLMIINRVLTSFNELI